jgi:DNA-binding PadR family transcriptional regulator
MNKIEGNILRGHLETMALSVLEHGDAHGFEILRRLEEKGCGALNLREGTLYPVLYRMEEAGLVTAQWESEASSRRGPRRRIYKITKKGRRDLAKRRESWRDFVSIVGGIVEVRP